MKKLLINFLKLSISLGLIIYLVIDVQENNPDMFTRLRDQPKNWSLLVAAFALILFGVVLTFVRWFFLVRALDLPFRLRDAFRLGFLGYLLNFVSLGAIGGDLFKAVFLAREQPGRRTAAVTTVVIDRLTGLVGLLLVATGAVAFTDLSRFGPEILTLAKITVVFTIIAVAALGSMMFRFSSEGPIADYLCKLPRLGHFFQRVYEAAWTYRSRRGVLFGAVGITIFIHVLNVFAFYCIANGLPDAAPSLAAHFFIVPLGLLTAVLPLPMEALGAFETALKYLYQQVTPAHLDTGQGLLIALVYRVIRILVAVVGVGFYLSRKREVDQLIHDVEEEELETDGLATHGPNAIEAS